MLIPKSRRLSDSSELPTYRRTTNGVRQPISSGRPLSTTAQSPSVAIVCMSISILPTTSSRCAPANKVPRHATPIICCASRSCCMPHQPTPDIWIITSVRSSIISFPPKTLCKVDLCISPQCAQVTIAYIHNHRRASGVAWVADLRIMPVMAR